MPLTIKHRFSAPAGISRKAGQVVLTVPPVVGHGELNRKNE